MSLGLVECETIIKRYSYYLKKCRYIAKIIDSMENKTHSIQDIKAAIEDKNSPLHAFASLLSKQVDDKKNCIIEELIELEPMKKGYEIELMMHQELMRKRDDRELEKATIKATKEGNFIK
jgi:SH3-like domain-containing protein